MALITLEDAIYVIDQEVERRKLDREGVPIPLIRHYKNKRLEEKWKDAKEILESEEDEWPENTMTLVEAMDIVEEEIDSIVQVIGFVDNHEKAKRVGDAWEIVKRHKENRDGISGGLAEKNK